MDHVPPLREAVGWLLLSENQRSLRVLERASKGPARAGELTSYAKIEHPTQLYRALDYLEERGLIDRVYETKARMEVFSASNLGRRALEMCLRIMEELEQSKRGVSGHLTSRPAASSRA